VRGSCWNAYSLKAGLGIGVHAGYEETTTKAASVENIFMEILNAVTSGNNMSNNNKK